MIGKRAKILAQGHVEDLLFFAQHTRHRLSLTYTIIWSMKAVDPTGEVATTLELRDRVAKNGSGRVIPIHPDLREALMDDEWTDLGARGFQQYPDSGGQLQS